MSQSDNFSERLYASQNTDELRELLNDLNERANTDKDFRPRRIRMAVYTTLQDNISEAREVREVIFGLWRLGMSGDQKVEPSEIVEEDGRRIHTPSRSQEDVWERHEARELLGKWMADWVDVDGTALREELCDLSCQQALDSAASIPKIQAACWTLGQIGWRSERVEKTFWTLLKRDDVAGDVASGILVNLGLDASQREPFIAQLRERVKRRPIRYNCYPIQRLGVPELVDEALSLVRQPSELSWYDGEPRDGNESIEMEEDMKHTFLSHLADELWKFEEAQDKIWKAIYEQCRQTEEGRNDLLFTGNLAPWCDSSSMVLDFLSVLPDVFVDERRNRQNAGKAVESQESDVDPHHISIHLAAERLQAALRPRQLEGWQNVSDELLAPFANLAVRNTFQTGYHTTSPMRAKENCWKMLAFAGGRWDSDEVQNALSNEKSGFVQGHIAELIACFGCDPLPPIVVETLTRSGNGKDGTRDISEGEDSSLFFACRGMENIARATASPAAFDALLGFNFVYGGDVLRSTNDALNEVAAHLIHQGDPSVVDALWEATMPKEPLHRRETAISALHHLSHQGLLPSEGWERFVTLAQNNEVDDYFRALAVQAIGFLPDKAVRNQAFDSLTKFWLSHRDDSEASIARSARESLARHGSWQRLSDEHQRLFLTDLGVEQRNGTWGALHLEMAVSEDMATLHCLYQQFPEDFETAVCDVLTGEENDLAYALTFELINSNQNAPAQLRERVVHAIVSQIQPGQTEQQAGTRPVKRYLFDALSLVAPQSLLEQDWKEMLSEWPAEVRVALAEAMGRTNAQEFSPNNASKTLEALAHDGSFVVRRVALRTAKTLMPELYQEWCEAWSRSEWVFERCIAAEGVLWMDEAPQEVVNRVLSDCEGVVREAARKSAEANRQRLWADSYLTRIEAQAETALTPHGLFAYGAALQKIGDDWHLHRLKHRRVEILSPAVRFWWREVTEGLEKEWRDRTRDWNHLGEGVISLHDDAILVSDGQRIEIEIWLWEQPRAGARSRSSWGGHLRVKDASFVPLAADPEEAFVELKDGRRGEISVSNSHWKTGKRTESRATFSGHKSLQKI